MRNKRIRRALSRACLLRGRGQQLGVTATEAGALRDAILILLNGYDDLAMVIGKELMIEAKHRRWRLECLARLLDDLGWSSYEVAATTITMGPAELLVALDAIGHYCAELHQDVREERLTESVSEMESIRVGLVAATALRRHLSVEIVGL